jgi:hypothetical protein
MLRENDRCDCDPAYVDQSLAMTKAAVDRLALNALNVAELAKAHGGDTEAAFSAWLELVRESNR